MPGSRALVVGGGVVGRSVAYYLSREGFQVDILDAGHGPSPTTCASLGVLTHCNGGESPYARLYRDGHALHAQLARELGEETGLDVGWRPLGGIDLIVDDEDEREAGELLRFNRERGCPVERLDEQGLRELEPQVASGVRGGLYFADDQRVDPARLCAALLKGVEARGGRLHSGERVQAIQAGTAGVEVHATGGRHRADVLVLCAGSWSGEVGRMAGAALPVRPVRGQHLRLQAATCVRHVLRHGGFHLLPDGEELVVGATVEEAGFALETTAAARALLEGVCARLLKGEARPLGMRAGLRPKPAGGKPFIGPLPEQERVYAAAGHYKNGVLLGPISGQVLARWIAAGKPPTDLQTFAPARRAG